MKALNRAVYGWDIGLYLGPLGLVSRAGELKLFGIRDKGDDISRPEDLFAPMGGAAAPEQRGMGTQPCLSRKPRAGERKIVGRLMVGAERSREKRWENSMVKCMGFRQISFKYWCPVYFSGNPGEAPLQPPRTGSGPQRVDDVLLAFPWGFQVQLRRQKT